MPTLGNLSVCDTLSQTAYSVAAGYAAQAKMRVTTGFLVFCEVRRDFARNMQRPGLTASDDVRISLRHVL